MESGEIREPIRSDLQEAVFQTHIGKLGRVWIRYASSNGGGWKTQLR